MHVRTHTLWSCSLNAHQWPLETSLCPQLSGRHVQVSLTFEDEERCPGKLIKPVFSISLCLTEEQGRGREEVRTRDRKPSPGGQGAALLSCSLTWETMKILGDLQNHQASQVCWSSQCAVHWYYFYMILKITQQGRTLMTPFPRWDKS